MGRLINTDDLNNQIMLNKDKFGCLSVPISNMFEHIIGTTPTADAQPVIHGEWLGTEYDGYSDGFPVYTTWKCSNCGAEFECEDMDFHYCPICGAYMDLKESKDGNAD